MKTLVVVTHPNMETSIVNKRWVEELRKYPEKYTVHELYKAYPDGKIDVEKEQQLIEAHGNLVLQFPIYWWSSPPLLKKWTDEVFTHGWAYGSKAQALKNKKTALAVTAGGTEHDFSEEGSLGNRLDRYLLPFETTFQFCNADYRSFFAFYGAEHYMAGSSELLSKLDRNAEDYVEFLDKL
ncbi:NAD(P)H-dependent oxidoreductase [Paenibacillus alba]|uniref:NAD(P)H-dependent oxidoreductase n=1 Tax=Paenibacillus alba TaxID=1197127 RepID=A0ABU6FYY1_9BACL|nr:NAD(P)H-dependent oxidoreductase [Paenibacillus alba]MEC0226257.1 NAD(P)H-dependent oxidoreductase [Paenibacillus alba]